MNGIGLPPTLVYDSRRSVLFSIIDPLNHETDFTYNDQGQETSRTLPIGVSTTGDSTDFVEHKYYDAEGRLDYQVSFEGVVTSYVYDDSQGSDGRLSEKEYFTNLTAYNGGSGTPSEIVKYTYDAFGRQVEVIQDEDGNLSTTSDQLVTDNTYDIDGSLVMVASPEGVIHYVFDPVTGEHTETWTASSPSTTIANSTTDTLYAYDSQGRLTEVTQDRRNGSAITAEATDYVYDLLGNLKQERLPNGVVTDYIYDDLNRLTTERTYKDVNANHVWDSVVDQLLAEYDYSLLADGKRSGVVETDANANTTTIDWTYDHLGRLTEEVYDGAAADYTADYSYDLVGNRLTKTVDQGSDSTIDETVTSTYDANDRLLTEADDLAGTTNDRFTVYGYGASNAGTQQTSKVVHQGLSDQGTVVEQETYSYNLHGQMSQTLVDTDGTGLNNVKYEYKYDAEGSRVSQTVTTDTDSDGSLADETPATTEYLNDKQNPTGYPRVLEEKDGVGNVVKSYTLGMTVIAQADAVGNVCYLLRDGHGSTRLLVNASGQIVAGQVYFYDAFGNEIGFDPSTALTSIRYSGERTDGTGLQYLGADDGRYYRAATGTFTTFDSLVTSDPLALHKYLYCVNDPLNRIDPTGREGELIGCLTALAIGSFLVTLSGCSSGGSASATHAAATFVHDRNPPVGKFILTTDTIPISPVNEQYLGTRNWGFSVSYSPPEDFTRDERRRIILVEATQCAGFVRGQRAHFDNDEKPGSNYQGHRLLPQYPGPSHGKLEIYDRPFNTRNVEETTGFWFDVTISAVMQVDDPSTGRFENEVLGSISLRFYDQLNGAILRFPGHDDITYQTKTKIQDIPAGTRDATWDAAIRNWYEGH